MTTDDRPLGHLLAAMLGPDTTATVGPPYTHTFTPPEPEPEDEWADDREIAESLIGRTITAYELGNSGDGEDDLGSITLTLDDGRRVCLYGWGHDWWGLSIEVEDPPEAPAPITLGCTVVASRPGRSSVLGHVTGMDDDGRVTSVEDRFEQSHRIDPDATVTVADDGNKGTSPLT